MPVRGMIAPWDATLPSVQRLTSRPRRLQRCLSQRRQPKPHRNGTCSPKTYVRSAVKHLSDGELDLMHAATVEELKRRGRTPRSLETHLPVPPDLTKIQSPPAKTAKLNAAEVSLTRGQLNAVRSAFKAGITPLRIAREFGISQSNVRKALASEEPNR
jgi:hypothetical protein